MSNKEQQMVPLNLSMACIERVLNVLGQIPLAQALASGAAADFQAIRQQTEAVLGARQKMVEDAAKKPDDAEKK